MIYILLNKLKINKKFNKYYFKVKNSKLLYEIIFYNNLKFIHYKRKFIFFNLIFYNFSFNIFFV